MRLHAGRVAVVRHRVGRVVHADHGELQRHDVTLAHPPDGGLDGQLLAGPGCPDVQGVLGVAVVAEDDCLLTGELGDEDGPLPLLHQLEGATVVRAGRPHVDVRRVVPDRGDGGLSGVVVDVERHVLVDDEGRRRRVRGGDDGLLGLGGHPVGECLLEALLGELLRRVLRRGRRADGEHAGDEEPHDSREDGRDLGSAVHVTYLPIDCGSLGYVALRNCYPVRNTRLCI